jgi:hypothetical protein
MQGNLGAKDVQFQYRRRILAISCDPGARSLKNLLSWLSVAAIK